jgi:hypothetical protein
MPLPAGGLPQAWRVSLPYRMAVESLVVNAFAEHLEWERLTELNLA